VLSISADVLPDSLYGAVLTVPTSGGASCSARAASSQFMSFRRTVMRAATVVLGSLLALGGCATASATKNPDPQPEEPMIAVSGGDTVFAEDGDNAFPFARARCAEAVVRTFKNTGHGIETIDPSDGTITSGKAIVYEAHEQRRNGANVHVVVSNKFYVTVSGNEMECKVAVTKLRAWAQTIEVDTRTRKWVETHLRGFMRGVAQELATAPAAAQSPGPGAL
jgi:hypothetical protein